LKSKEAVFPIPADSAAIGRARRFAAAFLQEQGMAELTETVVLLVSELVTNAILHSGSKAELRLVLTDAGLRAECRDTSSATPFVKQYSETATTGRGMVIVDALAKSWGAETDEAGKVVWFTLDLGSEVGQPVAAGQATRSRNNSSGGGASARYHFLKPGLRRRALSCPAPAC
jgi:anti-sigma regulatory factor (Ser/Thr protein kinase)